MFSNFIAFIFSLALFGLLLLIAESLRKWFNASTTRRIVHMCVGLYSASVPYVFPGPTWVYLLAGIFILFNAWTRKAGYLRGIHGRDAKSIGTVAFPMAMVLATALSWSRLPEYPWVFSCAFIVLALADPAAGFVGKRYANHVYKIGNAQKSILGSLVFFLLAAGILAGFLIFREQFTGILAIAGFGALVATLVEALGGRGWDNLFIVVAIVIWGIWLEEFSVQADEVLIISTLSILLGILFLCFHLLDRSGSLATCLMGVSLYLFGGWSWLGIVFLFFISGSLLSKWAARHKGEGIIEEKGHVRDAGQVYANGGVAWFCVIAHAIYPSEIWYWAFLGAISAAAADTFATEVGSWSKVLPRLIITGKRVAPGTSGGITMYGLAGSILGALLIAVAGTWVAPEGNGVAIIRSVTLISLAGLIGSIVDSLLGATLQAGFRTSEGRFTEKRHACNAENEHVKGVIWLGNDRVNTFCTLIGALFGALAMGYL